MQTTLYKSKIGNIKLTSHNNKLVRLDLNPVEQFENIASEFNEFVIFQLEEYFDRKRTLFEVPFDISSASDLNLRVWSEVSKIPYGQSTTYKTIAESIGRNKAYRAVGSAVGKNPIPIIIPCHRVIASNGGLGGFSLGLEVKLKLIKIEQMDGLKKSY